MDFTILDPIRDGRQRNSHRRQRYIRDASGVEYDVMEGTLTDDVERWRENSEMRGDVGEV
jgi:hypothetical protein